MLPKPRACALALLAVLSVFAPALMLPAAAATSGITDAPAIERPPFRDPDLPVDRRVDDLLSRLSVEERAGFLSCQTAAVPRLGIPRYWLWNEGLHGIMQGTPSTQFPQSIALAATFDPSLAFRMARATALEGRAYDNDVNNPKWPWGGWWFFSPNINLSRDPRWGRTQETYGEDPFLMGSMVVAFVKGMQGENPERELIAVATPKHFAANNEEVRFVKVEGVDLREVARAHFVRDSEPYKRLVAAAEAGTGFPDDFFRRSKQDRERGIFRVFRYEMDARPTARYLREYDFVPFEMAVREAGCASFMASYNAVNGVPGAIDRHLLTDVLRKEWGFRGAVVSDLNASSHLHVGSVSKRPDHPPRGHLMFAETSEVAAAMVKAGNNMDLGKQARFDQPNRIGVVDDLMVALRSGRITEQEITASAREVLDNLVRLGAFNPNDRQPVPRLDPLFIGNAEHVALAREIARKSFVLLKNEPVAGAPADAAPILPLDGPRLKKVVVGGPFASTVNLGNYAGRSPNRLVSLVDSLAERAKREGFELIVDPWITGTGFSRVGAAPLTPDAATPEVQGLRGVYFSNDRLEGEPVGERIDAGIDLLVNKNIADALVDPEKPFSVRWTGFIKAPASGQFRLTIGGQGRARVWLGERLVFDGWDAPDPRQGGLGEWRDVPAFKQGELVPLRIEYRGVQEFRTTFSWLSFAKKDFSVYADADVILAAIGLTPNEENEGGYAERTDLELPRAHEEYLKSLRAVNPRTVALLQGGSALSVKWGQENLPAMLMYWYAGEQTGNALTDVLFGEYSPAGRLPVTFYKDVAQLPPADEYDLTRGRTYLYFADPVLYPFGHGLGYTRFDYSRARVGRPEVSRAEEVEVSVDVKNVGARAGDEVVQLYVSYPDHGLPRPRRQLWAYERVTLAPGESRTVKLRFPAERLRHWDEKAGAYAVAPGVYGVHVGASSADIRQTASFRLR